MNNLKAQCVTLQYQGSGFVDAGAACTTQLTIPAADLVFAVNAPCTIVAPLTFASAVDITTNQAYILGSNVPAGATLRVTYAAAINDGLQNQVVQLTFQVKVRENVAPILQGVPVSVTVSCNPTNPPGNITATDNCDNSPAITFEQTGSPNACGSGGLVVRKWTAMDKSGNKSTGIQNITVLTDNSAPVLIQNAEDNVVSCDNWVSELSNWLQNRGNSAAQDNCSATVSFLIDGVSKNPAEIESIFLDSLNRNYCRNNLTIGGNVYNKVKAAIEVGFIYSDPCNNNSAVTTATFAATDDTAPNVDNFASDLTVECDTSNIAALLTSWISNHAGASFSDDCSSNVVISSEPNLANALDSLVAAQLSSCGNTGKVKVRFIGTDNCGNQSSSSATFTVRDSSKPKITKSPTSEVHTCSPGLSSKLNDFVSTHAGAVATDGCSDVTWSYTWKNNTGATGSSPSIPVLATNCNWYADFTFVVRDECNNAEAFNVRFSVNDTIPPVFTDLPLDITLNCGDTIPSIPDVHATDACSSTATVVFKGEVSSLPNGCLGSYTIDRAWEAVDSCGNKNTGFQRITVIDNNPPILNNIPSNVTVNCNTIPALPANGVVTATDECDGNPVLTFEETFTRGNNVNLCNYYTYSIFRKWTAVDKCGNINTAVQTITVRDDIAPTFTVPSDVTVECYQVNNLTITGQPDAVFDDCNQRPSVTYLDVQKSIVVSCSAKGITERTWIVSDGCNTVSKVQSITSRDTEAPIFLVKPADITLSCDATIPTVAISAIDSCDLYVQNDPNDITEDLLYDFSSCPGNFSVVRLWTATDDCQNKSTLSQKITYIDNVAPRIVSCPKDITIDNTTNSCDANVKLVAPVVEENCQTFITFFSKAALSQISSASPGDVNTPVDDVNLNFNFNLTPNQSVSNVQLKIDLLNIDGENALEYFNVVGEDGTILGKTAQSSTQCGNSSTLLTSLSASQIYNWASDGVLKIKLKANIPSNAAFAINDICGNSLADAMLSFSYTMFSDPEYSYKIDQNAAVTTSLADVDVNLPIGKYKVTYYVKDCSNNADSCSYNVTVADTQKPTMYPSADKIYPILGGNDCDVLEDVIAPTGFSDNCGSFGSTFHQKQLANGDSLLRFTYDPNYLTYFADDVVFNFSDVTQSALNENAVLEVKLQAKATGAFAWYEIYGEDNTLLGTTASASCNFADTVKLIISPAQLNSWAADGKIVINAIRFKGIPINLAGTDPGINACGLPLTNGKDNVSWMTASLTYNTANPSYYVTGATNIPPKPFFKSGVIRKERFNRGESKVFFTLADAAGNIDTVSYKVTVIDFVGPVAKCKNAIAYVNPFTTTATPITADLIDNGSSDNCGIQSRNVFPFTFSCFEAGQTKNVTLTVRDSSGRQSSCVAMVYVDNIKVKPGYNLGLCGNDTLELFSNPPVTPSDSYFLYQWSGPNGFVSTERDPKIPNVSSANSGTYKVTVTNPFASCQISGEITVPISNTPNTPILSVSSARPCSNGELVLSTQSYTGKKPVYKWFKGTASSAVLLDSTSVPSFSILNPIDTAKYFVMVVVNGCASNQSAPVTVFPIRTVSATTTNPSVIEICEGENIVLGTAQSGLGYDYKWTGPNGFSETTPYPPVIVGAKPINSGTYTLIISTNGCAAAPANTQVNVKPKPATPLISAIGRDCEGATINLVTNIIGASSYSWIRPDFTEEPTQNNLLVLGGLTDSRRGDWRVAAIKDGCRSENSLPLSLKVNAKPVVTATAMSPVCEGASLTLMGTAPIGSSYIWSTGGTTLGLTQNITIDAQEGNYTLSCIAPNGCDNASTISVTTVPAPQITGITSNAGICASGSTDAKLEPTITPLNVDLGYSYQWTGPNVSSTERILTIPNVTAAANGSYTLVVKTATGCASKPYTFNLGVKNIPATPIIKGASTQSLCEGKDLLLELENAYTGANVKFKWKTPAGDSTTANPTFTISDIKAFHAGEYSVKVIVDGCESNSSGTKKIVVNPIPGKPEIGSNSPVCEGNSIKLKTPQISGALYEWSGPGFSSSIAEPIISNAGKDREGSYRVRVLLNGCFSEYSDVVEVIVNATPQQIPAIKNNGPVCMDLSNPSVMLSVDATSAIPGAVYSWYNTNNVNIGGTPGAQLNYTLNLAGYPKVDSTYEFYVIASVNGCPSKASIPTVVYTNKIPNQQAFAGADINVCDATSVTLKAAAPIVGSGAWVQTDGSTITIANPNAANSAVNGLVAGQNYTLQWKLSNGACKNYAFDEVKINVNDTNLKADAGDSINICKTTAVTLKASPLPQGTTGVWSQLISQEQLGITIKEPTNPNSLVTGLTPGNQYIFRWIISNAGCKDYSSDEVYVTVETTSGFAKVEADKIVCGNSTVISAVPVAGVVGSWIALGGQEIVSPNSSQTTVKNLRKGRNQIMWVLKNAACGVYSTDTLNIDTEPSAIAATDNVDVQYAQSSDILILKNDIIPPAGYILALSSNPKHGKAKVSSDGSKIEYKAPNGYAGADEFEYELCNANCPDACTTAKVFINILGSDDCTIPTIITPNDDLINDLWEIPCIAGGNYPNTSVAVFNQWGAEVYRSKPYRNDWQGTYNGKNLPEGTYFFVVDFGNGQKRNGFLLIER